MVDELLFENYTDRFYPASDSGGPPIYLNPKILEITDWLKTKMVPISFIKIKEPNKLSDSSALYSCLKMLQAQNFFYTLTESYPNLKPRKGSEFTDFILEEFGYQIGWVGGGITSDNVFEKVSELKDFSQPINSALVQTHLYRFRRYSDFIGGDVDLWMLKDINSDWAFAPNLFVLEPPSTLPSFMNWDKAPF